MTGNRFAWFRVGPGAAFAAAGGPTRMGLVLGFVLVASAIGQPHGARMVLYRLTEEYSRQKPFPSNLPLFTEDWEIPAFPDRTRSEAWLLFEGGRTLRSVASTTTCSPVPPTFRTRLRKHR